MACVCVYTGHFAKWFEAEFKSIMGSTGLQRNQTAFELCNDFARHSNDVLKLN